MKILLLVLISSGASFAVGAYIFCDKGPKVMGDLIVKEGIRGVLFSHQKPKTFQYKEGHFKIPDQYNWGYDSIQVICEDSSVMVTRCYPKKILDMVFDSCQTSTWQMENMRVEYGGDTAYYHFGDSGVITETNFKKQVVVYSK
jgi:hypothetical protein